MVETGKTAVVETISKGHARKYGPLIGLFDDF